jgi:hypothetical protein
MAMLANNLNCWLSLLNREEKTDTADQEREGPFKQNWGNE